ncbi:phosphoribosylformylglycinamidine synthase subunit PurQ [Cylindrospermopsis raciborskii]|uniref:Phosphoribosylformylglycinamidine synthase subunit PurQ n=1 Tax=Cylindrospermopsis raciborskii CENA302 TaxID=1170768 RepID=A0A9Q5WAP2_9CYAN|nr:phosphoribosylformylglycinamidine synthase subunit PurQ [Cylindrospermopsis raciborskii]NLQ05308.1 phosphoribosylformylglycinamidine synthase subunit PurQ [Cylindrospermopsis raciborskii MVCC19]OPH10573.1 phosphoribosylformylglycinamidine synthase I [Cylindrospermopsis raciborskii CENA302]
MKFGVLVFPGSNCDRDAAYVTRDILGHTTRMVWHQERDISDIDVIIIPGGFSYGDYLRCGAIARFSPVMQEVVNHAEKGKFIIGICNGFQVLTEVKLLPGALTRNQNLHFICDRISVKVERNNLPWTSAYGDKEVITLPIAHGEGRFYADKDTLAAIEDNQQVLFRYDGENPNGSLNNIAGICNRGGNVLGMMPHPERAADRSLGGTDGLRLFQGLIGENLTRSILF